MLFVCLFVCPVQILQLIQRIQTSMVIAHRHGVLSRETEINLKFATSLLS